MEIKRLTDSQLNKYIKTLTTKISNKIRKDVGFAKVILPHRLTVQTNFLSLCPNRENYINNDWTSIIIFFYSQFKEAYRKTFTNIYNSYLLKNIPTK